MIKKIGFDATSITRDHDGGKNQVTLNLLQGFGKNGVAERFVVFCLPEMETYFLEIIPEAVIIPVPVKIRWKKYLADFWLRTFQLPGYLAKYNIGVLLFPAWNTGIHRYRIPTVVIPHDIQIQAHKERFFLRSRLISAFFYHFDFKLRDRIIAISNFDKQEITRVYPAYKEKIVQIFNPIQTDLFLSAGVYQNGHPYITAVNIQHHHKNVISLIKAFAKIKDTIPHDLYLIGRKTLASQNLVDYVNGHDLHDRVIFKGFLDDLTLAEVLKGSALYVNPSLFEGFGMTAVEAMLAGVPTLAANVSAIPEVTMGLCAYYQPPEDIDALAAAISSILLHPEEKSTANLKMISTMIHNRYNYMEISGQYFKLLKSLMGEEVGTG